MKATFFQRAGAYLIDYLIIIFIFGLLTTGMQSSKKEDLQKSYDSLQEKFVKKEISSKDYLDEYTDITFKSQKSLVVINITNTVLIFAYFVVFQYLNNGQSIGKKVFKLRIVDDKKKKLTFIQMLIRGLMIYSIASGLINILLLFSVSKNIYMTLYTIFGFIEILSIILCVIFILYRNDKLGLHDIITKTKVIKE